MLSESGPAQAVRRASIGYTCAFIASLCLSFYWGRTFSRSFRTADIAFEKATFEISTDPPLTRPIRRKSNHLFAFVFYGDDPMFVKGAIQNARMVPLLMPGWNTRFYIDGTVPDDFIAEVARLGGETVRVSDEMAGWNEVRRLWRYLILDDPAVEYAVFRDIDSRVSVREILAIQAWVHSGMPFHAMHDHPHHNTALLGGMWGAYVPAFRNLTSAFESMTKFVRGGMDLGKFGDQTWLASHIFSLVREGLLSHDSFICNERGVKSHPFPAARSDHADYVGRIIRENYGVDDPYYIFGSKNFNGTQAPLKCRLSPEYVFG